MSKIFVLLWMLFFHVVADYNLQGVMATMKQKTAWKEIADAGYANDYVCALMMHSISWSFMVMLPLAWHVHFNVGAGFVVLFFFNVAFHMKIDNEKANMFLINLWGDQLAHLIQIAFTWMAYLYILTIT